MGLIMASGQIYFVRRRWWVWRIDMVFSRSWLRGDGRGRFLGSRLTVLVKTVVDKVSCDDVNWD